MVKLSHKSKRVTCKKRYKIEQRIKDHNKKVAKKTKDIESKPKKKFKNLRVPNKFPMKEEILQMAEQQKLAALEEKKKKLVAKKKAKAERKANGGVAPAARPSSLSDILKQAENKQEAFNRLQIQIQAQNPFDNFELNFSNKDKENSLKTFYKEFKKVVDASDVIIEVLDARDPVGTRCPQVEEMILNSGKNQKLVLLLNKIDLVPKENVQAWLKYLRSQYPTVAFKASTQNQNERLSQSSVPVDVANQNLLTSAKCLGADILVKLLTNYTRINDVKQTITVGIIGLPNVGKSSVINSLKRSHACQIGSMPGLTRCMQEIKLDKHIKLLDCPGIVMSKDEDSASLALKNCIKLENLEDPVSPIDLLLKRCNKEQLILRYKIGDFADATQFLTQVAKRCGKVKKGGIADIPKAAQLILNDWTSGKLTYYTTPPKNDKIIDTQIVTELAPAFDIDALLKQEEEDLFKSMDDTRIIVDGVEVEAQEPIKVNFEELEKSDEEIEEDIDETQYELNIDDSDSEMSDDKEDKNAKFKSDVVLNPKLSKKLQLAEHKSALKRKAINMEDENEIYESENIPRTKKMHKLEAKKKLKRAKKNEKLFSNLGEQIGRASCRERV